MLRELENKELRKVICGYVGRINRKPNGTMRSCVIRCSGDQLKGTRTLLWRSARRVLAGIIKESNYLKTQTWLGRILLKYILKGVGLHGLD